MTLTEAVSWARRYSRMSSVTFTESIVKEYIAEAEVAVALEMIDMNPSAAAVNDSTVMTYSSDESSKELKDSVTEANPYKVIACLYLDTADADAGYLLPPAEMKELSGSGESREDPDGSYVDSLRWHYDGKMLYLYPVPSSTTYIGVRYVLYPVAQTTDDEDLLDQFTDSLKDMGSHLVCLRAAQSMCLERGFTNEVLEKRIQDVMERITRFVGTLQFQETQTAAFYRWYNSRTSK